MRRFLWNVGFGLVVGLAASPALATTPLPLSDGDLADGAHVIVIGRAIARQTVWVGQDLAPLVTVAVDESLKDAAGPTVTVALPGGIDWRRKIPVEVLYVGAPQIAADEEVLLFLERGDPRRPGPYVVSGFAQGKLSIVADPAGVKWVARDLMPTPRDRRRGGSPARSIEPLSDFKAAIRGHLHGDAPCAVRFVGNASSVRATVQLTNDSGVSLSAEAR
jgi:hypothetical protein